MESSDDPDTPNLESILDAVAAYRHKRDELLRQHRSSGRPYSKAFTKDWKQSSEEFGLDIRQPMKNATNADIDALVQQMDRESGITSRDAWLALRHASPISFYRLKHHFFRLKRGSETRCNLSGLCRDILVRDPDYFLQVMRSDCLKDRHFVANLAVSSSLASHLAKRLEELAAPIVLSWRSNEAYNELEFVLSWFNRASVLFRELLDPMALGDDEADQNFALKVYTEHDDGRTALFSLLERKGTSSQNRISILVELASFFEREAEYLSWMNVMLTPKEHEVVFSHVDFACNEIRSLAARLLGVAGCPEKEDLRQFFLTLADHREADFRVLAIPGLVRLGEVDFVVAKRHLKELLDDPSSSVRSAAISGLAELVEDFSLIRDSLERMLRDSEASVRSAAAMVIGDLTIGAESGCESVVEALLQCFTNHQDDPYCILVALGNIGAPMASVAAGPLLESIKREGDHRPFGSTNLLETLCEIGLPAPELDVEPILDLIGRGYEVELAVKVLRTIAPEKLSDVIPKLVEMLDDSFSSWKQEVAIRALGDAGASAVETIPKIIAQLESSQVKIQIAAMETLGKIGSDAVSKILPILERHFDSETPAIAVAAIRAAGLIGSPEDHELAELLKRRLLTRDQEGDPAPPRP